MVEIPFVKMEAVGNDFVLIDTREVPPRSWPDLAVALCERHLGVGSDGLLVVGPSERADFRLRMFNPDGTEDQCGNGIRCGLLYWAGRLGSWSETRLTVESLAGVRSAVGWRAKPGPRTPKRPDAYFQVAMGSASFSPRAIPAKLEVERLVDIPLQVGDEALRVTSLSTGTAHTVIFSDSEVEEGRFQRLSPLIENHPAYPERTSVLWSRVLEGGQRLKLRIWERAVGETLACGTGACAAAAAAWEQGIATGRVIVESPGGEMVVERDETGTLYLTGPVREVYRGFWPL